MSERIAIIDGLRSPVAKAYGKLKHIQADTLGSIIAKELVLQIGIDYKEYSEVIIGNVAQPTNAANMARVLSSRAGFPISTPAYTVHRNCASGMQAISSAMASIRSNEGHLYLVGGVESMSNIPILYSDNLRDLMISVNNSKTLLQKLTVLKKLSTQLLKPVIGLVSGLTDPISGQIMGLTAEILANEFKITRHEQDEYALLSHKRAQAAIEKGLLKDEIYPIVTSNESIMYDDDGIRFNQNMKALEKLHPFFDKQNGTVTAGNSSQISDGACMLAVCSESYAKSMNLKPLGYIKEFAYAGLEAHRMGLGPVYATKKLFDKTGMSLKEFDLIEMNEAFAAQILANIKAFNSKEFCKKTFNSEPLGAINEDILNVNGGAIAFGHPVGMSGARIVLAALKELKRRKKQTALATLCVGGGQGASFVLEAN